MRNVFTPRSWVTAQMIMSHEECGYATFSNNCAKDHESCGMFFHHVTAQKIMSHIECVYANDGVRRIRSGF